MAATNLDWLWLVGGCLIGAAGAALLIWALWRDRARGRLRCGKCWYEMEGVPVAAGGERTCPECGSGYVGEAGLRRTRRRWRWVAPAVVLLLLGYGAAFVPGIRSNGWTGAIPSPVLALIAPPERPGFPGLLGGGAGIPLVGGPRPPGGSLCGEVWDRLENGRLASWESQWYLSRVIDAQKISLASAVGLPPRWPRGVRMRVQPGGVRSLPLVVALSGMHATTDRAGTWIDDPEKAAAVDVALKTRAGLTVYRTSVPVSLQVTGSLDTFLEQDDTPETTGAVSAALAPRLLRRGDGGLEVLVNNRTEDAAWEDVEGMVAYRVSLLVEGEEVGNAYGRAEWRWPVVRVWQRLAIEWRPGGEAKAMAAAAMLEDGGAGQAGPGIRFVVRGDPLAAGGEWVEWWNSAGVKPPTTCWTGEFAAKAERVVQESEDR